MARSRRLGSGKTGLLSLEAPNEAAEAVIGRYVRAAQTNLAEWAAKYQTDVQAYLNDPEKVALAKDKLAAWYEVLSQNRAEIARAYENMRVQYRNKLAEIIRRYTKVPGGVTRKTERAIEEYQAVA